MGLSPTSRESSQLPGSTSANRPSPGTSPSSSNAVAAQAPAAPGAPASAPGPQPRPAEPPGRAEPGPAPERAAADRFEETELAETLRGALTAAFPETAKAFDAIHKARTALQTAEPDAEAIQAAFHSFSDKTLSPPQRRAVLADAAGEHLTHAATAVASALEAVSPDGAFEQAGLWVQERIAPDGQLAEGLSREWWSNYVPTDLADTGRSLDGWLDTSDPEALEGRVDALLAFVRILGSAEADNLERVLVEIEPEHRPAVADALTGYMDGLLEVLGQALSRASTCLGPAPLASPSLMLRATEPALAHAVGSVLEGVGLPGADRQGLSALAKEATSLTAGAIDFGRRWGELADPEDRAGLVCGTEKPTLFDRRFKKELEALGRTLDERLDGHVEVSEESATALRELREDLRASVLIVSNVARMVGAIGNPHMDDKERAAAIQDSAEAMGPLFVKLLQTAANQGSMLGELGPFAGLEGADVVMGALEQLQDRVSAMPFEDAQEVFRESTGRELPRGDVYSPEAQADPSLRSFTWFDPEPLAAASIGQVHRARLLEGHGKDAREVDVVVKIQRPGLEQAFERTGRVGKLSLALFAEYLHRPSALSDHMREVGLRMVEWLQPTLEGFIESFGSELDFREEAKSTQAIAHDLRGERFVVVPKIHPALSTSRVLVMDYMAGDKLSVYLDRYARALEARKTKVASGPLGWPGAREEAAARAKARALQVYGLEPTKVQIHQTSKGYLALLEFDSRAQPRAELLVRQSGRIDVLSPTPDFSEKGLSELKDRLLASFAAQVLVHGLVHGDLHKGNFLVLGDGETLALLDLGNTIQLDKRELWAPLRFTWGFRRRDPRKMAEGLFGMSEVPEALSPARRAELVDQAEAGFRRFLEKDDGVVDAREVVAWVSRVSADMGLPLSPVYLQAIKTTASMVGNLHEFQAAGVPPSVRRSATRVAGTLVGDALSSVSPHAYVNRKRKERRLRDLTDPRSRFR